jgi:hypothetical protein
MKLTTRGWIVLVIVPVLILISLFTYATRDLCYVGKGGNALGYGSCTKMIDEMIGENK